LKNVVGARYLVSYIGMVAMCFVMVAGIGYYAGPAHLASRHYEDGMAAILLSGSNVGNPGNFDWGTFEKCYVSELRDRLEVVVLGSSRSRLVGEHLFEGNSFFNSSVVGGRLGDCLAIYGLYEGRGLVPSVVVLGLDPWWLEGWDAGLYWRSLKEQYVSMAGRLNLAPSSVTIGEENNVMRDLLSLPYFVESVGNLILYRNGVPYFATDETNYGGALMLRDGSSSWPEALGATSPEQVKALETLALTQGNDLVGLSHSAELDEDRKRCLEAFVDYLRSEKVELVFYLAPFHPTTYDVLMHSDYRSTLLRAETYFRDMAHDKGVTVVGSYDPQETSCAKEDFFDGYHPTVSGVDKIFSGLDLALLTK